MMMRRFAMLLALLGAAFCARADEPVITVQISADRLMLHESLSLNIQVERASAPVGDTEPRFDPTGDVAITGPSTFTAMSSSLQIVNGQRAARAVYQTTYQYEVRPLREGELTIPSATIVIDGQTFRTNPVPVTVARPPRADFGTLRLAPEASEVYVGQPVGFRLECQSQRGFGNGVVVGDVLPQGVTIWPPRNGTSGRHTITLFETGLAADVAASGSGVSFTTSFDLIAERPGAITIGPIGLIVEVAGAGRRERFELASEPVTLTVKPLPTDDRPPGFNGLVGTTQIEASLSAAKARVGDPLTLTVKITGEIPPERVAPPLLTSQPAIAGLLRLANEGWTDAGVQGRSRVYSMMVRPQQGGIEELPPIEMPYFNPASGRYEIAKSRPMPLVVESSREVTAADALGATPSRAPGEPLVEADPGLLANRAGRDRLVDQGFSLEGTMRMPAAIACLVAPPVVWGFAAGAAFIVSRRDPAAVRRRRYLRAATRAAAPGTTDPARLGHAAQLFVAAYTGQPEETVTSEDAARLFDDGLAEEHSEIVRALESREGIPYGNALRSAPDGARLRDAIRSASAILDRRA